MAKATAGAVAAPVQVGTGLYQLTQRAVTTDADDASLVVGVLPTDFNSSRPVCPPSAPLYKRPRQWHRTAGLTSTVGTGQDSSALPTAVPTWVGYLAASVTAGATTLTAHPLADYGQPPNSSQLYVLDTGAACEVFTVNATPTGGPQNTPGSPGLPWTLTRSALTFGNHSPNARLACIGASQTAALNCGGVTNGLPSGAMGGRGTGRLQFNCLLTAGSAPANVSFQVLSWDDLLAAWVADDVTLDLACATGASVSRAIRIDCDADWYLVQIPVLTGAGALAQVTAQEAWS